MTLVIPRNTIIPEPVKRSTGPVWEVKISDSFQYLNKSSCESVCSRAKTIVANASPNVRATCNTQAEPSVIGNSHRTAKAENDEESHCHKLVRTRRERNA